MWSTIFLTRVISLFAVSGGVNRLSSAQWFVGHRRRGEGNQAGVLECTQHPGELMYVPDMWGHATLNLRESIGVALELGPPRVRNMLDVWDRLPLGVPVERRGSADADLDADAWQELPAVQESLRQLSLAVGHLPPRAEL